MMEVFKAFSIAVNNDFLFILILYIVSLVFMKKEKWKLFTIYFIGAILFTFVAKLIFYKERMCSVEEIDCPDSSAFPSGHALMSFATSLFFYRDRDSLLALTIVAFVISISRIYIGVHDLLDIAGGFSFAVFYFSLWWKCGRI